MKKEDLRIVYMGTPDFAVEALRQLVEGGYNVVGVITMPDKPAGRGHKIQYSPVKQYALEHAALTAVHGGINRQKASQPLHHRVVFTGGDTGAQSARRAQRGGDILAESKMMEMGGPLCQRRAEHRPVSHAFAGRRGDPARHCAGAFYHHIHLTYPGQWPMRPDGTLPWPVRRHPGSGTVRHRSMRGGDHSGLPPPAPSESVSYRSFQTGKSCT